MWNGSSWSEVADLNQVRNDLAGTGIYTSALAVGGIVGGQPPTSALTETWNGSSWTEVGDLNTNRRDLGITGSQPDNTAAIVFGGQIGFNGPKTAIVESWNGSSWTEIVDLNTSRYDLAGGGTNTAGIAFAGRDPNPTTSTEEFSTLVTTIETITDE